MIGALPSSVSRRAALLVASIVATSAMSAAQPKPAASYNTILTPVADAQVGGYFNATGSVNPVTPRRHLWLVVRLGRLYWPKEPELQPDASGRWTGVVNDGGSSPTITLLLMDVSDNVSRRFSKYLGESAPNYPGLPEADLQDFKILDTKVYRR